MTTRRFVLLTLAFLTLASMGGAVASFFPVPLPWMTGSLVTVAVFIALLGHKVPTAYVYPQKLRWGSTAVIGIAIGSQVTMEVVRTLPQMLPSIAALLPFVILAQVGNYLIFHKIGKYDRPLAFYAGSPGGLVEAISMGEEAGAELRRLTAQQFLRLIIVLISVPAGLSLWIGAPVGSAAGMSFSSAGTPSAPELLVLAVAGGLGLYVGRKIRLPAWQIIGPLIVTALTVLLIWPGAHLPPVFLNIAQVGVGASLGLNFLGISGAMLRRAFGLSLLSLSYMFTLALGFAVLLTGAVPLDPLALVASFAPGGVTEMALVALSLGFAPAAVTLHHLIRIMLTVMLMRPLSRMLNIQ